MDRKVFDPKTLDPYTHLRKPQVNALAALQAWALAMVIAFWTPLALFVYWMWVR